MHRRSSRKSILNEFSRSPRWPLCRVLESKVFVIKATGCYPSLRPNERNERNPSRDGSAARYLNNLIKRRGKEGKRENAAKSARPPQTFAFPFVVSLQMTLAPTRNVLLCSPRLLREKSPGWKIFSLLRPRAF